MPPLYTLGIPPLRGSREPFRTVIHSKEAPESLSGPLYTRKRLPRAFRDRYTLRKRLPRAFRTVSLRKRLPRAFRTLKLIIAGRAARAVPRRPFLPVSLLASSSSLTGITLFYTLFSRPWALGRLFLLPVSLLASSSVLHVLHIYQLSAQDMGPEPG